MQFLVDKVENISYGLQVSNCGKQRAKRIKISKAVSKAQKKFLESNMIRRILLSSSKSPLGHSRQVNIQYSLHYPAI
jgi:hypothetical protein